MGSEKNLVTKARLEQIKTAESELVDNLFAHANASLSQAHGIDFLGLPNPTLDSNGNNISFYADSGGDRVGLNYMRLTYNNVIYFAPVEFTTLEGKGSSTGISPDTNVTVPPAIPGSTAWVTDFTPDDEADLNFTNQSVLLPHTQLSHWEAHTAGVYQILPQLIIDSAGHTVSNYVAHISVDGVEMYIPCDTRLGGPLQPPRNVARAPASIVWNFAAGESYAGGTVCNATWAGTAPFTVRWQLLTAGSNWTYLTNANGTTTGVKTSFDTRLQIGGHANNGNFNSTFVFTTVNSQTGANNGKMRIEVVNASGTAYAEVILFANNETSCTVFSAGVEAGLLGFSDFRTALNYRLKVNRHDRHGDEVWGGYIVLGKRLKPHIMKRDWLGRLIAKRVLPHVAKTMRWRLGKEPYSVYSAMIGFTYWGACFVAYGLWRKEAQQDMERIGQFSMMRLYHARIKEIRRNRRAKE